PVSTTPDRVAVFDSTTGIWSVDNQGTGDSTPPGSASFRFGLPGDTAIVGDWNGAGFDEVGVYRVGTAVIDPVSGLHALIFSLDFNGDKNWDSASGDQAFIFGLQGDQVVVGDWNGDGKDEVGIVRPGSDGVLVWCLDINGATGDHADYVTYHFGLNDDT